MRISRPKVHVYAAIADPTRRTILLLLAKGGEKNVSELQEPFSISQPAVSKHLRILRDAGLVRSRQEGRRMFYAIEARKLQQVYDWVAQFEKYWDESLDRLGDYLDKQEQNRRNR
jgi:DNA-binding transcriptional ArsR family regulator